MVEIVAEISGNHGGDLTKAAQLIRLAAWAGCHYAKFQYYIPNDMPDAHVGNNREMYERLMVPKPWLPVLFEEAERNHIGLFASVFSVRAMKELAEYDISYVKLASPESTRLPLETYQQICLEVPAHVDIIASSGKRDLEMMLGLSPNILYCPAGHPPHLTIADMNQYTLGPYMGLSDHTPGVGVPAAFMRIPNTKMIEKHIKLDDNCEDARFSATPQTMKTLCNIARGK